MGALPDGYLKLQAVLPTEALRELDVLCERAGRISRAQVLRAVWPQVLDVIRTRYDLGDKKP